MDYLGQLPSDLQGALAQYVRGVQFRVRLTEHHIAALELEDLHFFEDKRSGGNDEREITISRLELPLSKAIPLLTQRPSRVWIEGSTTFELLPSFRVWHNGRAVEFSEAVLNIFRRKLARAILDLAGDGLSRGVVRELNRIAKGINVTL